MNNIDDLKVGIVKALGINVNDVCKVEIEYETDGPIKAYLTYQKVNAENGCIEELSKKFEVIAKDVDI